MTVQGAPSQLNGTIEVFGAPAAVIVANPNGITCSGCGVVNTPRLTFATGAPQLQAADGTTATWANASRLAWDIKGGHPLAVVAVEVVGDLAATQAMRGQLHYDVAYPVGLAASGVWLGPGLHTLTMTAASGRCERGRPKEPESQSIKTVADRQDDEDERKDVHTQRTQLEGHASVDKCMALPVFDSAVGKMGSQV